MTTSRSLPVTHVGSLPRPERATTLLMDRETGERFEREDFDSAMRDVVHELVDRQLQAGVSVVSDGEASKITYSTYVKDRLSGFDGDTPRTPARDLADYPELRKRLGAAMGGAQSFQRQSCVADISYFGHADVAADIDNMHSAMDRHGATQGFLNAASPGLVTAFQPNSHYEDHQSYLEAVADAMRVEYETIAASGLQLQLDCPDLAMARHTGFQTLSEDQFLDRAERHVEALNVATANIDADQMRMHLCWGNYEGPHDHDIELSKVLPIVLKARPQTVLFEAANPRHAHEWQVWADTTIPDDKVLVPGAIMTTTNYVDHPEHVAQILRRFVDMVGPDRVMAGTDCGFGTFAGIGKVDPDVAYKKLRSLARGAELALAS